MSPMQRSIAWLKQSGYHVAKLERWNAWAKIRQDIWGADLLAFIPVEEGWEVIPRQIYLIQVTTTANISARQKKILSIPEAAAWVKAGHRFVVHGWSKKGPRGKRKTWQLTEREILV